MLQPLRALPESSLERLPEAESSVPLAAPYAPNVPVALVVEDDVDIRVGLRLLLESEGYEVVVATDGEHALRTLASMSAIDLIVTDLAMPHVDGLSLIESVRESLPEVPIVAVSGAEGQDVNLLLADINGANRVLSKPFDHDEFLEAVEGAVG